MDRRVAQVTTAGRENTISGVARDQPLLGRAWPYSRTARGATPSSGSTQARFDGFATFPECRREARHHRRRTQSTGSVHNVTSTGTGRIFTSLRAQKRRQGFPRRTAFPQFTGRRAPATRPAPCYVMARSTSAPCQNRLTARSAPDRWAART